MGRYDDEVTSPGVPGLITPKDAASWAREQRAKEYKEHVGLEPPENDDDNLANRDVLPDPVNHPAHYGHHASGVECITITEHMSFCMGNAVKYIWRADLKGNPVEDLRKAAWYLNREITRREKMNQ